MKSPEDIKKGLYHCGTIDVSCTNCPYDEDCHTQGDGYCSVEDDALIYIELLETRLAQAERERDAAVREWKRTKMDSESMCWTCKHALMISSCRCRCVSPDPCDEGENWEWRGVCEENTKEE